MGPFLHSLQISTCPKAADQTRDVTWPLVVTDPCCFKAVNPEMAHQWQHKPGPHHGLGSITSIRMFLATFKSPVLPPFIVPISFCFSFSSISPPLTCSSPGEPGSPSVWSFLRSGLWSAMPCSCIMASGKGHLGDGFPPAPSVCMTGGHPRIAPCPGSMVPV